MYAASYQSASSVALPLLARLYVRKKDLPAIDPKHRPEFRTKLELAVELLRWAKPWLNLFKLPIWVVADGAYAKKEVIKPAKAMGMTVVSRLREDAGLGAFGVGCLRGACFCRAPAASGRSCRRFCSRRFSRAAAPGG